MGVKVCCGLVLGVVLQVLMVNESVRGKQVRRGARCLRYVHCISIFFECSGHSRKKEDSV